jgi:hypothetical protein
MQHVMRRPWPLQINTYPACLRLRTRRLDVFLFSHWHAGRVPTSTRLLFRLPFVLVYRRFA